MIKTIIGLSLGSILLALGLPVEAQQPTKMARIGYLIAGDPVSRTYRTEAFRQGLKELGYIEGKNIAIEYRFAEARERLPELARELVGLKVDIIFAGGAPAVGALAERAVRLPPAASPAQPAVLAIDTPGEAAAARAAGSPRGP